MYIDSLEFDVIDELNENSKELQQVNKKSLHTAHKPLQKALIKYKQNS
ncbi:3934_t:CDS:2 [Dentiscutata erythropus]|uniref:3934_t:CDS:1 n=1 Tax=Dentiscutata erythropus TaxID=1348616 RepID=A0A9N9GBM1_9GLOM|nr:3934_t:CDS:2 [Dentiscutata erythropus]